MYPPCVFVYAKSVGSWMRLGHIHIQLYNETFIVHANTSTSINQLKYMVIHSWFYEVWAHKTSPTPPILFEVFIPSKEGEWSCARTTIFRLDFGIVHLVLYFCAFILFQNQVWLRWKIRRHQLLLTTMLVYDQPQMLQTVNQVYKGVSNINLMI